MCSNRNKIYSGLCNTASFVINNISSIIFYPTSIVTALPSTMYAVMFPSGEKVSELSAAWWQSMSTSNKFFSAVTGFAALATNSLTNAKYLSDATYKIKNDLVLCYSDPLTFFKTNLYLLLAASAALSAATLSYDAFIELDLTLAICMALFQLLAYGARRYAGTSSFFERFYNTFNEDAQFQNELLEQLERIDTKHYPLIDQLLREMKETEITENNAAILIQIIYNRALEIKKKNESEEDFNFSLFKPITAQTWLTNNIANIFDFTMSATLAYSYYMLNGQKGYDGINIITKMISGKNQLDGLNDSSKQLIAFLPGIASSMQVAINGLDFRTIYFSVYKKIKERPILAINAMILIASSALAATAMATAAKGVISQNNLYNINEGTLYGSLFVTFNWLGNFCILGNASIQQAMLHEEANISLNNLISYLKKRQLSKKNISLIKQHGFFANDAIPLTTESENKNYRTFSLNPQFAE